MEETVTELKSMRMRWAIGLSEYVICIAKNDEKESVKRRNFGEGTGKERWDRHERHVLIARSSAENTDVGFCSRWEVMKPGIEYA